MFGLFVRADTEEVRTRSGLGIGLALVRQLLTRMMATCRWLAKESGTEVNSRYR